jgi:hypothetical protein
MSDNWNVIIGSPDDDDISGTSGNDIIFAGPGDDLITPGEGNDVVFGGGDFDTVRLEGSLSDYDIQTFWWLPGIVFVTDLADGSVDRLVSIERIEFDNAYYDVENGSIEYKTSLQLPASLETDEDTLLTFAAADGTAPFVTSADPAETFHLLISVQNGVVNDPDVGLVGATLAEFNGTAAEINAHLDGLEFVPAENYNGTATISYHLTDSDNNLVTDMQQSITVDPVNDAPVLDNSGDPMLTAISEDIADGANTGTLVSDLVGASISDVDAGAVEGIAITALDESNGHWQYQLASGGGWVAAPAVSPSSALLLGADDLLRFVPDDYFSGTASVAYQAWDQTSGVAGGTADATVNGDATAFSTATETATIDVQPYAQNSADLALSSTTVLEDQPFDFAVVTTLEDTDGSESFTAMSISGLPAGFTLSDGVNSVVSPGTGHKIDILGWNLSTLQFTPAADANGTVNLTLNYQISDTATLSGGEVTNGAIVVKQDTVTIEPVNDAPVADAVPDQSWTTDTHSELDVSAFFSDADGDTLIFTGDFGTADAWLDIDPDTGELTADPVAGDEGAYDVTVTGTDPDGLFAQVHFTIDVSDMSPIS